MRTIEIVGYRRTNSSKADLKKLREEGYVPCVLYGGKEHVDFYAPAILFRELIYTPDAAFVKLNIEGQEYDCIIKDSQFHPVSENLLHADFLRLEEGKPIKMNIPVRFHGSAPGMLKGGRLMVKLRYLIIKALSKYMPAFIDIDISHLELGKSVKVSEIKIDNFEILNPPQVSIASVSIPRQARIEEEEAAAAAAAAATAAAEAGEAAAGAEGAEGTEAAAAGGKEKAKGGAKEEKSKEGGKEKGKGKV
jgi:large subunit ribosomal protein L25